MLQQNPQKKKQKKIDQIEFLNKTLKDPLFSIKNPNFKINPRTFSTQSQNSQPAPYITNDNFFIRSETIELIKYILNLLGLKYITSKTEAESYCAYLQKKKIVDFIITEDSDIFLFGGKNVIRNFSGFIKGKLNLKLFSKKNIKYELGLNRERLVLLGYLLGCDYCEGVRNVGVVNALEILTVFGDYDKFCFYLKKWGEFPDLVNNWREYFKNVDGDVEEFFEFHKNYKKYWIFPKNFPDFFVKEAFFKPDLDFSEDLGFLKEFGDFRKDEFFEFLDNNFDFEIQELNDYVMKFENGLKNVRKVNLKSFFRIDDKFLMGDIKSDRVKKSIQLLKKKVKKKKKINKKK